MGLIISVLTQDNTILGTYGSIGKTLNVKYFCTIGYFTLKILPVGPDAYFSRP